MNFVDANVVVYAEAEPDSDVGKGCVKLLSAIGDGRLTARMSTAVLEEIWHVELRSRPALRPGTARKTFSLFRPLLPVTDEIMRRALDPDVSTLRANDRIHAATCFDAGISTILTADAAFDRVAGLSRVDPADHGAVQALLS
jgi:predicted nucleic acid-binding protein